MAIVKKGPRMITHLYNPKRTINPIVVAEKDLGFSIPRNWCKNVPDSYFVESNQISGWYDEKESRLLIIPIGISEFNYSELTFNIPKVREFLEPFGVIRETTYKRDFSSRIVTRIIDAYSLFSRPGKRKIEVGILVDPLERKGIPHYLVSRDEDWIGYKDGKIVIKLPYEFYNLLDVYIEDPQNLILNFLNKYKITK